MDYTRCINSKVRGIFMFLSLATLLAINGCTINHDYQWSEYTIKQDRVTQSVSLNSASGIQLLNGQADSNNFILGTVGAHIYHGTMNQLTEAVISQFATELGNRNIRVSDNSQKKLELTLTNHKFIRGLWVIRADMILTVKDGNGLSYDLDISNTTGGSVDRLFDGAISVATIALLNDPRIKAYLEEPIR